MRDLLLYSHCISEETFVWREASVYTNQGVLFTPPYPTQSPLCSSLSFVLFSYLNRIDFCVGSKQRGCEHENCALTFPPRTSYDYS